MPDIFSADISLPAVYYVSHFPSDSWCRAETSHLCINEVSGNQNWWWFSVVTLVICPAIRPVFSIIFAGFWLTNCYRTVTTAVRTANWMYQLSHNVNNIRAISLFCFFSWLHRIKRCSFRENVLNLILVLFSPVSSSTTFSSSVSSWRRCLSPWEANRSVLTYVCLSAESVWKFEAIHFQYNCQNW